MLVEREYLSTRFYEFLMELLSKFTTATSAPLNIVDKIAASAVASGATAEADDGRDDDAEEDGDTTVDPRYSAKKEAIDKLKSISDMGLMKIATEKMAHDKRVAKRKALADAKDPSINPELMVPAGRWSMDVVSARLSQADEAAELIRNRENERIEALVAAGASGLGGEIEALRGHYASLVMGDNWNPQVHEDVARELDAIAEAAKLLNVPQIQQEAENVALGVRQMAKKITELGSNLL